MTADQAFSIANAVAAGAWILIIVFPRVRLLTNLVAAIVVPCLFAAAYVVILSRNFDPSGFSKFATLAGLMELQATGGPWLTVAGWLHYLAFDLFAGTWEVRTARDENMPRAAVIPCLILTYMLGPFGLLCFVLLRLALRRRASTPDAVTNR